MASLFNTRISDTYPGLIKTIDNAAITATLKEITDGNGTGTGLFINTAGDFKVNSILEFGSLKDTAENIIITKFVDAADGISNNDNDTTIPTTAAIIDYVAAQITIEDLDFIGDTGTGQIDLDSQILDIGGTSNEITTVASGQSLTISLDSTGVNLPDNSTAITQTAGDNSTKIATTSYVDTLDAASDLDITDGTNTGDINLNTQSLSILGTTNEINTVVSGQSVTIGLPSTINTNLVGNVTGNLTGDVTGDLTGNVTSSSVLANGVTATTQSSSDDSTKVATTAYVKGLNNASDLDFTTDSGSGAVVLNSETLSVIGTTNEIETSGTGQEIQIGLPSSISTNLIGNVTGNLTGNVTGDVTGDLTGNSAGTHTGAVIGNVTGNVVGDLTGNADTATAWETARDLSVTGQASATITGVDGTSNVSAAITLDNNSVTSKVLTGLPTPAASSVLATDSIVQGIGKLQSQINGLAGGLRFMGSWDATNNNPSLSSGGGEATSGTTTSTTANKLVDSTASFLTTVTVGDQVINQIDGQNALVSNVDSDTTLSLDNNIMVSGEAYTIDNSPFITQGHYYVVNVGGTHTLNGISNWSVGDWVIAGANNQWTKLDHTQIDGTGTGDANDGNIPRFTASNIIGDSIIRETGGNLITVSGSLSTTGNLNAQGDFAINTNKFTTQASTGNTNIAGTTIINDTLYLTEYIQHLGNTSNNIRFTTDAIAISANATFAGTGTFGGQLIVNPNANTTIRIGNAGTNAGLVFAGTSDELYIGANNTHQIRCKTNNDVEFVSNATFGGNVTTENIFQVYSTGASVIIGAIGNTANDINIYSTTSGHNGLRMHANGILPTDNTGTIIDNDADLGDTNYRFKDLYLGGSITSSGNSSVLGTTTVNGKLIINNTSSAATQDYRYDTAGDGAIVGDINFLTNAAQGSDDRIGLIRSMTQSGSSTTRGGQLLLYTRKSGSADFNQTTYDKDGNWVFPAATTHVSDIIAQSAIYVDTTTRQTDSLVIGRQNGNIYEFGHDNQAGQYYGVLGVTGSSGHPFIGFSTDVDYGTNTFTTRGAKGAIIRGESGNLFFETVATASASGQTPVTNMEIFNTGLVNIPATADGNKFTITSSAGANNNIIEMGQVGSDGFLDVSAAGGGIVSHLSGYTGYASYFLSKVGIGTNDPQGKLDSVAPAADLTDFGRSTGSALNIRIPNTVGHLGQINFCNTDAPAFGYGSIGMVMTSGSGIGLGDMVFGTKDSGSAVVSTERMRIDSNGVIQLPRSSNAGFFNFNGTALELDVNRNPETGAFSVTNKSHARIQLAGDNGGSTIKFNTASANNTTASERMRITSGGNIVINSLDSADNGLVLYGGSSDAGIIYSFRESGASGSVFRWYTGGTQVGSVSTTASSTSYNTSSDYRLKENVVEMTGALDRVSQLKPSRFNFIADADKTVDGFLAHEVQEIVPEAITGEKDAVDKEGNPEYQAIDLSKLVPLLVGAIQELKAEIETLKTQINN